MIRSWLHTVAIPFCWAHCPTISTVHSSGFRTSMDMTWPPVDDIGHSIPLQSSHVPYTCVWVHTMLRIRNLRLLLACWQIQYYRIFSYADHVQFCRPNLYPNCLDDLPLNCAQKSVPPISSECTIHYFLEIYAPLFRCVVVFVRSKRSRKKENLLIWSKFYHTLAKENWCENSATYGTIAIDIAQLAQTKSIWCVARWMCKSIDN